MNLYLTFKTPDVMDDAIQRAVEGLHEDDREDAEQELRRICRNFIKYSEYVTIIIDTKANTATVQHVS